MVVQWLLTQWLLTVTKWSFPLWTLQTESGGRAFLGGSAWGTWEAFTIPKGGRGGTQCRGPPWGTATCRWGRHPWLHQSPSLSHLALLRLCPDMSSWPQCTCCRSGMWPFPSLVEEPGLWKALGGQQLHKVLRSKGKGVPSALGAAVLWGEGSGRNCSQRTAGVRLKWIGLQCTSSSYFHLCCGFPGESFWRDTEGKERGRALWPNIRLGEFGSSLKQWCHQQDRLHRGLQLRKGSCWTASGHSWAWGCMNLPEP